MSWKKAKLGDVCTIEKGTTGIQKAIAGEYPLVVTGEERKSHNEYQFDCEAVIVPLVSGTGHGHASIKRIHFQSGKFALGNILCAIIPKDSNQLLAQYLYRFLDLNKENELVARMKGMANVTLPIKEIAQIEIPLPSIKEQAEFVEMYLELETKSKSLSSELTHQLSLVKKLRQQLLQDAVQGKLTAEFRSSHPELVEGAHHASELLKKIKAEKATLRQAQGTTKKEKELPPIKAEEIPFDIPKGWVWCRLGEIAEIVRGGSPRPAGDPTFYGGNIPFLKVGDLTGYEDIYVRTHTHSIKEAGLHKTRFVEENTLMLTNSGATLGVPRICTFSTTFNDGIAAFLNLNQTDKIYLYFFLKSKSAWFLKEASRGQGQPNLNTDIIAFTLFPLPPLLEQHRIVQKLDELMQTCDALEASIKESAGQNEKLLQQVLREALQP